MLINPLIGIKGSPLTCFITHAIPSPATKELFNIEFVNPDTGKIVVVKLGKLI